MPNPSELERDEQPLGKTARKRLAEELRAILEEDDKQEDDGRMSPHVPRRNPIPGTRD